MPMNFGRIMRSRLHRPDAQRILRVLHGILNIYKTARPILILKGRALSPSDGLPILKK